MRKNPQKVVVTENGETIGVLTPKQFMSYCDRPNTFLSTLVREFNEMKEAAGDGTRVTVYLNN